MRVGIFMLAVLYCVWQIKSDEEASGVSPITKESGSRVNDEKEVSTSGRDKEYLFPPPLVSPYGGTLKILMGISLPISLTGGRTMSFASNFQFQFPMPQNATFFTNYFENSMSRMTGRWRRSATNATSSWRESDVARSPNKIRSIFYRSLEMAIERWGGNGRACVMKSVCEAAETPLEDQGLVGQLFHVILTPNYGTGSVSNTSYDHDDYLRASLIGKNGNDCSLNYPECTKGFGLLDRVSKLIHI